MKFKLEIDMGDAAFEDYPHELERLILGVKLAIETARETNGALSLGDSMGIHDRNGNKVGTWEVTE